MQVRFWGVRGSVPWSVPSAARHGCNTPCLEITDEQSARTIILDAGTGIVGLGQQLIGTPCAPSIVLTHYHWDHLQGLPFFPPLYAGGSGPRIYAPVLDVHDPAWLERLFQAPFFPVSHDRLPDGLAVEGVRPGGLTVDGFDLAAVPVNHPGGALAFRVRGTAGDLVYATDHEFGDPRFDEPLADLARGAAAIVLDAHFTPDEIAQHHGWGHSDWRGCARFASACGAGALWLFHHKPGRTDDELARIRAEARQICPATQTAAEGDTIHV